MTFNWLGTTAIALLIGTGAVIAQAQTDVPQKREEGSRAQSGSSKDIDRLKDRASRPESKSGGGETQRGEAEHKRGQDSAQQQDSKQPTKQSQDEQRQERSNQRDQAGKEDSKSNANTRQGRQEQSKQERSKQEQSKQDQSKQGQSKQEQSRQEQSKQEQSKQEQSKQEQSKQGQSKQDNARGTQPADTKQQQGQQQQSQPGQERSNQAAQPSGAPAQQGQSSGQANDQTTRSGTGQPSNQAQQNQGQQGGAQNRRETSANDSQRTQVFEQLRRDRSVSNQNINIQVNIGQRLPPRVRARPLPSDIVRIMPQYRGYQYTVIEDQVVIVNPRSHEVVDVVRESGPQTASSYRGSGQVSITTEQRETLRQAAHRMSSAQVSGSPSNATPDSSCLSLQPVPEELVRSNPDLGQYRYLAIGDQIVLIDPRQQKVVQVID